MKVSKALAYPCSLPSRYVVLLLLFAASRSTSAHEGPSFTSAQDSDGISPTVNRSADISAAKVKTKRLESLSSRAIQVPANDDDETKHVSPQLTTPSSMLSELEVKSDRELRKSLVRTTMATPTRYDVERRTYTSLVAPMSSMGHEMPTASRAVVPPHPPVPVAPIPRQHPANSPMAHLSPPAVPVRPMVPALQQQPTITSPQPATLGAAPLPTPLPLEPHVYGAPTDPASGRPTAVLTGIMGPTPTSGSSPLQTYAGPSAPGATSTTSTTAQYEQLGCGWDLLTQSCRDVFQLGWCRDCVDLAPTTSPFLHDCRCTSVTALYTNTAAAIASAASSAATTHASQHQPAPFIPAPQPRLDVLPSPIAIQLPLLPAQSSQPQPIQYQLQQSRPLPQQQQQQSQQLIVVPVPVAVPVRVAATAEQHQQRQPQVVAPAIPSALFSTSAASFLPAQPAQIPTYLSPPTSAFSYYYQNPAIGASGEQIPSTIGGQLQQSSLSSSMLPTSPQLTFMARAAPPLSFVHHSHRE